MRRLAIAAGVAIVGLLALATLTPRIDPYVPVSMVAVYNLWLLGTVTVVAALLTSLCFRLFEVITGGSRR